MVLLAPAEGAVVVVFAFAAALPPLSRFDSKCAPFVKRTAFTYIRTALELLSRLAKAQKRSSMPRNFKEGMRRLGIVAGVLGAVAGAIGGYLLAMDAHSSAAKGLLGEPVLVDYVIAAFLPIAGFVLTWGAIRVLAWIGAGFSEEPRINYGLKVNGKIAKLTKLIDEAEHLLRKHGEETWAKWLAEGSSHIRSRDFGGIEHILSGFGGTGSFNDIYISPANNHAIKERQVVKVNDRLRVLSARIYELAQELQDEEQTARSSRDRAYSATQEKQR